MLKEITHIEGLQHFEEVELVNDTDPTAVVTRFFLKQEEMPFLTIQAGKTVRHNFIWIEKIVNLGNLIFQRRINDSVEYDKEANKWKINKLYSPQIDSDIIKHPNEWNAFARGNIDQVIGTPLTFLFKTDPAKVTEYKAKYVSTVEQLANLTDTNLEGIGLGGKADRDAAKIYLGKIDIEAPILELSARLEELERKLARKESEIINLRGQISTPVVRKKGPKKKVPYKTSANAIAMIEGESHATV